MPELKRFREMTPEEKRAVRQEGDALRRAKRVAESRAANGFEPLKITARLQSPVISDAALPIDGILYYMWHREQFGRQDITLSGISDELPGSALLPLERRNTHVPEWFYAASWAQWDGVVTEGTDHWNKRLDIGLTDYLEIPKSKLDISAGRYKSYHMPVFTRHALAVHWYVVSNKDSIWRLLKFVTNIGKKGSQGYGAVLDWSMEPTEDYSERGADGRLMRAIPSATGTRLIGYRPSYWNPRHQAMCEVPTDSELAVGA
jgi:CRISPR type IV-associated protein Csf3